MTEKMLKFVQIDQQTPNKRKIDHRMEDFKEIYDQFIHEKAREQSSRFIARCITIFQIGLNLQQKEDLKKQAN